jgi:hypothetical protein
VTKRKLLEKRVCLEEQNGEPAQDSLEGISNVHEGTPTVAPRWIERK